MTPTDPTASPSRRQAMQRGAGLAAVPAAVLAAGGAAPAADPAKPLTDPKRAYPKPPFPRQEQEWPGLASKMDPKPDHGEGSYRGANRLAGRKALVTGGDSGIGRAAVVAFAREGADVAVSYLPAEEPDAREVKKLVEAAGRKCVLLPGDLRDEGFCKQLVADAVTGLGGLDVLVLNAAYMRSQKSVADHTTEQFDSTFKVNVYAPFWLTRAAVPHLPAGASVILTASVQAYEPSERLVDYAMTKACNVSFAKSLAQQLAPKGIRVNAVAPGPFWTPLQVCSGYPVENVSKTGADTPIGRPGQPVELAAVYVLLASADGSYLTGEVFGGAGGKMPF